MDDSGKTRAMIHDLVKRVGEVHTITNIPTFHGGFTTMSSLNRLPPMAAKVYIVEP